MCSSRSANDNLFCDGLRSGLTLQGGDQCQTKGNGAACGRAGDELPVGDGGGADHVGAAHLIFTAGVAGGAAAGKQAVLCEHARRGANGGGAAAMLDGMIERMEAELTELRACLNEAGVSDAAFEDIVDAAEAEAAAVAEEAAAEEAAPAAE